MMEYVDTHTHFVDEIYQDSPDALIGRAVSKGVTRLIQADTGSKGRETMYAIAERHPGIVFNMLGLYPGHVDENWRDEVSALEQWRTRGAVAIGEIGLDYYYGAETASLQKEALLAQFELARAWDLPVNIHLRDATEDWFAVMEKCRGMHLRGNLHCYSASYEVFERMQRYGDWSVGIGGVVTFKKAHIAEDIVRIPLDRILLETDAPYLAPTPLRGTVNESANIPIIAARVAELKGITVGEVARATTANARKLFNI